MARSIAADESVQSEPKVYYMPAESSVQDVRGECETGDGQVRWCAGVFVPVCERICETDQRKS